MRRLALLLTGLLLIASGCGFATPDVETDPRRSGSSTEPFSADSLAVAERLYREALSHYVEDEWDEAGALLDRTAAVLGNGTRAESDEVESWRSSLASRADHFLGILSRGGYVSEPVAAAAPPSPTSNAHRDTMVVRRTISESREKTVVSEVPVEINSRVQKWLDYFQGRGRPVMARWLSREPKYRPMVERILAEHDLPSELFCLAMIESGLSPKAYSHAHAVGMWQFISSSARMHDLRVDWWVDERRDPEKATYAAAKYLTTLYEMFGSWELALAGYNSGEGRVSRAQRKSPSCPDYWCLDLPRETENFVPKFMAAVLIVRDPQAYGFERCSGEPLAYDSIEVTDATDLGVIADAAGVSTETIREMNPAIRRWCTPPSADPTTVRVPVGTASVCVAAIESIPPDERVTWTRHKVTRGETLSGIARAYGTSVRAVMGVNDITNVHRIYPGDYVIIPIGPEDAIGDRSSSENFTYYKVRRGDTVSSIARRHGRSTRSVLRANGLGWRSRIYPGDTIKIPM